MWLTKIIEAILYPYKCLSTEKLTKYLNGKTVLLTGASYGIGEALAYLLAPTRAHLILVARTQDKLELVQRKIATLGGEAVIFQADLRVEANVDALATFVETEYGGLDFFVSNAGKSICRPLTESLDRYHDFSRTMALNYFAPVRLMLRLIPLLSQTRGQVVHVSAVNVLLPPIPHWAAYQSSKVATDAWFRSAMPELYTQGISVSLIYLPLVRTPMIEPTVRYSDMPAMSAEHAAKQIARTMLSKRKMVKPWWLFFCELPALCFRRLWDFFVCKFYKIH